MKTIKKAYNFCSFWIEEYRASNFFIFFTPILSIMIIIIYFIIT